MALQPFVHFQPPVYGFYAMQDGGMVSVADVNAYLACCQFRVLMSQIHAHLADSYDICLPALAEDFLFFHIEVLTSAGDNLVDGDNLLLHLCPACQNPLGELQVDVLAIDDGIGQQAMDDAFQLADTVADIARDVVQHIIGDVQAIVLHNAVQDAATQTFFGLLHLCHQSALETGDEPVLHTLQRNGRTIAGHDNLLAVPPEVVEDVEESILSSRHTCQLLHVIHDEHIDALVEVHKVVEHIVLPGIGELHHEEMCAQVKHSLVGMQFLCAQTHSPNASCPHRSDHR